MILKQIIIFLAPESFSGSYNHSSNVYKYSFFVFQIITGKVPLEKNPKLSLNENIKLIERGYRPDVSLIKNEYVVDFLQCCWQMNPKHRPSFGAIVDQITNKEFYSFFDSLDHKAVKNYLDIYGDEFDHLKSKF